MTAADSFIDFEIGKISDAENAGRQMRSKWKQLEKLPNAFLNESGIRKLEGKHITFYTDIKSNTEVDRLPQIFDLLVSELCAYFEVELAKYDKFHVRAFLIDDLSKFSKHGIINNGIDLRYGYSFQNQIWVRRQKSGYYQRHLFMHEGVHAFMFYAFGTSMPIWYCEGIAEMLATHKLENGKLKLGWFPTDSKSVPNLGRIETVKKIIENNDKNNNDKNKTKETTQKINISELSHLLTLDKKTAHEQIELYEMCWSFVMFCEHHRRYCKAFRKLVFKLTDSNIDFAKRFIMLIARENKVDISTALLQLEADWNDFKKNICYDYDFNRAEIDFSPLSNNVTKNSTDNLFPDTIIHADRGWQNSGLKLEAGKQYKLTASGKFQLAEKPDTWRSEPDGITIKYNQKMPIGKLQAMIIPDINLQMPNFLNASNYNFLPLEYKTIGSNTTWQPTKSGLLLFKINDAANSLHDNKGKITIKIK
jgi:hypothetical protein